MTSAPLSIIAKAAPLALGELRVERFGWTFTAGDKVMQAENDYDEDVYHGDLGFIARIDPEQGDVAVDFEGRGVAYDVGELDAVVPAYATTVHKAQGSEYPAVVIPLVMQMPLSDRERKRKLFVRCA